MCVCACDVVFGVWVCGIAWDVCVCGVVFGEFMWCGMFISYV